MTQLSKMAPVAPVVMVAALLLSVAGCSNKQGEEAARAEIAETPAPAPAPRNPEAGHGMVLLRGLPTLGTANSIAIVELDPESPNFGAILQEVELPHLTEPLHHLYYSPAGRLYATGLDPKCSLAEVALTRDAQGKPVINEVKCLDTGGQQVGEDIFWHPVNGKEQMFVTFMGGTGLDQADCGSVGVFDPQTNALVKTIEARKSTVPEGAPFIMYPHGISAYGDRIVVGAASHPDLKSGIGNTITIIDANTLEPIQTIVVEDSKPVGFPSAPVEVLFVRPSIVPGVQPAVLVNTMMGFETWKVPYDEATKTFGAPAKLYDGAAAGTGVPLEFYGSATELFISHAVPGVVKRYALASLPELVSSGADIKAEAGAHHMMFYTAASGRNVIAVQNNLINLGLAADNDPTDIDFIAKLNDHSITVHDLATGERLARVSFKDRYKKGVENIEALFGPGFVHHH